MNDELRKAQSERMSAFWKKKRAEKKEKEKQEAALEEDDDEEEIVSTVTPAEEPEEDDDEEQEETPFDDTQEEKEGRKKMLPETDLELTFTFTNPQWGDEGVNKNMQDSFKRVESVKVHKGTIIKDSQGNLTRADGTQKVTVEKDYWSHLGFLTRDLRLANYDTTTYNYCSYMYELAGSLLNEGYYEASSIAMEMAAIHGEMSQGRKGFLRRIMNTLIREDRIQQMEVKKNNILGGKVKDPNNPY